MNNKAFIIGIASVMHSTMLLNLKTFSLDRLVANKDLSLGEVHKTSDRLSKRKRAEIPQIRFVSDNSVYQPKVHWAGHVTP